MSWSSDLILLRGQVAVNADYAPADYPLGLRLVFRAEYSEMYFRLTELIASAPDAGRRVWLELAKRELELAKDHINGGDNVSGGRSLNRCEEYLGDAVSNRNHAATFIADASGNLRPTADHEPALPPPPKGKDPDWPLPVLDPTWMPREPKKPAE